MLLDGIKKASKKFILSEKSNVDFFGFLDKLKDGDNFTLKILSKKEIRSSKQNKYYHSVVLKACQYYLDELNFCNDPKTDSKTAHYQLKLNYCFQVRNDLIEIVKFRNPNTKEIEEKAIPFSWSISNMPHKEACQYIDWCCSLVRIRTGKDFDRAINDMDISSPFKN